MRIVEIVPPKYLDSPCMVLFEDDNIEEVSVGMGPGYWDRVKVALQEKGYEVFREDFPKTIQFMMKETN